MAVSATTCTELISLVHIVYAIDFWFNGQPLWDAERQTRSVAANPAAGGNYHKEYDNDRDDDCCGAFVEAHNGDTKAFQVSIPSSCHRG